MKPLHTVTPLWESDPLSEALGARVRLKMEAFQPVGSFKIRGIGHACQQSCEAGASHLVSSSGGNAGYAAAYAARRLGVEATIIVPETTSERSRKLIQGEGARVIEHGPSWDEAHAYGLDFAEQHGAVYIHPFDEPKVWSGHAALVEEVAETGWKPDALVVSVGGAGLLCGILEGLHRVGWTDVRIVATETRGAESFAASVEADRLVTLDRIASIAVTLGARTVTPKALDWSRRHPIVPCVVSDREALEACRRFAGDHRVLVELACGAALAAVYGRAEPLLGLEDVLVIVCGGAGVTLDLMDEWDARTAS
ncbi:MAG: pyridoxal-phosphate dependent enzyme [Candidatus Latescibacteria bacterium]|jgi:L-serine/L-threonine ammonia-lyase|nr:pyridoxal-phosphate dependent enzyme [Candidatus Latescibacterota bacterium]